MPPRSPLDTIKTYLRFYSALSSDKRTPGFSKALPWIALLYALLPIDFIPDFLPVIGQLDDIGIIIFLLVLAYRLIPSSVRSDYKRQFFRLY